MNKRQIVYLIFILIGLSVVLFLTFSYFKNEEEKYSENAKQNRLLEQEEKEKQENGQKEVAALLEILKGTKKIVLGVADESETLEVLDKNHSYKELKTIVEEANIQEILSLFFSAKWEENKNLDYKGKIWQFYDIKNNLILEYDGHSFLTKEKTTHIFITEENEERLNSYFTEV